MSLASQELVTRMRLKSHKTLPSYHLKSIPAHPRLLLLLKNVSVCEDRPVNNYFALSSHIFSTTVSAAIFLACVVVAPHLHWICITSSNTLSPLPEGYLPTILHLNDDQPCLPQPKETHASKWELRFGHFFTAFHVTYLQKDHFTSFQRK